MTNRHKGNPRLRPSTPLGIGDGWPQIETIRPDDTEKLDDRLQTSGNVWLSVPSL